MASTYTTNSGIEKPASGEQSGTWGATVNTNMDIVDTLVSGFISITAGSTSVTLTTTDGSVTAGMNRAIKYVDGGDLGGNCTVTIAPNDQEKLIFVENGLSASRSLIFTQGSGANFTLQNGKQALIRSDGAGSGAAVYGVLANLEITTLEVTGAAAIDGALTAGGGVAVTGNVTATGTVEPAGDTAAADNAAIGYTSAEGLILTGQGSTNDITIKNDADADVITIATGGTNVAIAGDLTISGDDLFMATNTSGAALIADGTNFNPVVISGDISINTSGVAAIGSAVIVEADIADNAVTLAKMASGTDGNIISYDTSGNPAAVATGTSGHILTSAGAGATPTFAANATIGQHTIWFPAGAMEAAVTTAAATSNAVEIGTSLFAARTMDFATGADDFCYFGIQMPKSWDAGTLVCQFVWSATGTTANTVLWAIAATSLGNDEVLTTAFPTPASPAADTNSTTADDLMLSAEVTVTVGSTPTAEDYVIFEVSRDVSGDTLAEDARLHGIKIHYTTDAGSDT